MNSKRFYLNNNYIIYYFIFYYSILLKLGFPLPYGDDLFFLGTSLHYERTGEYLNPGVEDFCLSFSDINKPYWFVPLHMQMMGWWLKLTGITDLTVRLYIILCSFITTFFVWLLAKQYRSDKLLTVLFLPLIISFGYTWSFRPECTAIPLFIIGLYLIQKKKNFITIWGAISCFGLSTISSQILLIPSVLMIISNYLDNKNYINLSKYYLVIILCALQTSIIGLYIINFEIFDFFEMYRNHISKMSMTIFESMDLFIYITCKLGNGYILKFPSYIIIIIMTIVYINKKGINYTLIAYISSLIIMILIYAKSELTILFLCTLYTLLITFLVNINKNIIIIVITSLVCLKSASVFFLNVYINKDNSTNNLPILDKNTTYVIDEYTIREPLNLNLPPKWKMIPGYGCYDEQITKKPKDEVWIVSSKNLSYYYPNLFSHKKFVFLDKEFNNISPKLWKFEVIE